MESIVVQTISIFFFHILFTSKCSWSDDDIYPEDSNNEPSDVHTGNFTGSAGESAYSPESGTDKVYVKECFFSSFSNRAISFDASSSDNKMLIEFSTFESCSTDQMYGGCIYQSKGNFVMNKCCGFRCYSSQKYGSGHFVCADIYGNKNSALDSSMSLCYNVISEESDQSALFLRNGNIVMKTVNFSKHKCKWASAFICFPKTPTGTSIISFVSINDNIARDYAICWFGDEEEKLVNHELLFSNIINNQCSSSNVGLILAYNPLQIKHCCILDNIAPIWFEGNGATITIINCTIKEEDITKTLGSVITNDWKPSSSFINAIKCTEDSEYCQASYDAIGTLTPNIPNSGSGGSDKGDSTRLNKIFKILEYIFLLCFIPSY